MILSFERGALLRVRGEQFLIVWYLKISDFFYFRFSRRTWREINKKRLPMISNWLENSAWHPFITPWQNSQWICTSLRCTILSASQGMSADDTRRIWFNRVVAIMGASGVESSWSHNYLPRNIVTNNCPQIGRWLPTIYAQNKLI